MLALLLRFVSKLHLIRQVIKKCELVSKCVSSPSRFHRCHHPVISTSQVFTQASTTETFESVTIELIHLHFIKELIHRLFEKKNTQQTIASPSHFSFQVKMRNGRPIILGFLISFSLVHEQGYKTY